MCKQGDTRLQKGHLLQYKRRSKKAEGHFV